MKVSARKGSIYVCDFSGGARSGKGTIVRYLADTYEGATRDETGADYRLITKALLLDGRISEAMSDQEVSRQVERLDEATLLRCISRRDEIIATHGFDSLYAHDTSTLVPFVGRVGKVRQAVKAGFQARVATVRDSQKYGLLLIDGRGLAKVVEVIEGVEVVLRVFVSCSAEAAAHREWLRDNIAPHSPEAQAILQSIRERNKADATRAIDPVKPDDDALAYHEPSWLLPHKERQQKASALGAKAVRTGRQIHLDTTSLPLEAMKEVADYIVRGALKAVDA